MSKDLPQGNLFLPGSQGFLPSYANAPPKGKTLGNIGIRAVSPVRFEASHPGQKVSAAMLLAIVQKKS